MTKYQVAVPEAPDGPIIIWSIFSLFSPFFTSHQLPFKEYLTNKGMKNDLVSTKRPYFFVKAETGFMTPFEIVKLHYSV